MAVIRDGRDSHVSLLHWHAGECRPSSTPLKPRTHGKAVIDWWWAIAYATKELGWDFVRYEDILENPVPVVEQLAGLLGVEPREVDLDPGHAEGHFRQGGMGGWRDFMPDSVKAGWVAKSGPVLEHFGYSLE